MNHEEGDRPPPNSPPDDRPSDPRPDPWLVAQCHWLTGVAAGAVLDAACGWGRNAVFLARLGLDVVGVDRDPVNLGEARGAARRAGVSIRWVEHDLERHGLPVGPWGAVVMTCFLHRPLLGEVAPALVPGGVLLAMTHLDHASRSPGSRPRRRSHRLGSGELLASAHGLTAVVYDEWAHHGMAYAGLVAVRQPSS